MQQPIPLEDIIHQIKLLRRGFRVNAHRILNGDITIYVIQGQNTVGNIELLNNDSTYHVDWAKADGKMAGKGKLLYYMAMNEAWPNYVGPGPRTNEKSARVWQQIEKTEGIQVKEIDGKKYFRLKTQFDG